ncbi:MAG: hypothetical protein KDH15_04435 [Rhodocyclaceae bacterium]|nr:hypothetical protein [Rhodocyclaceae bacterium]
MTRSLCPSLLAESRTRVLAACAALALAACTTPGGPALETRLEREASAGPLAFEQAQGLFDNDAAFAAKLKAIEEAKESLDLAYYIFADDHSSARLSQALIAAARRGVRVRILVDYFSAYPDLDRFSWLEREGGSRLQVRFYNRPTLEIIRDAAYLTTSCADVGAGGAACDLAKQAAIARQFAVDSGSGRNISNRAFAGSGLFLSGLYGRHARLMAYAVARGQDIDADALTQPGGFAGHGRSAHSMQLAKRYFRSRYLADTEGIRTRLQLAFARQDFAEAVNPVFDSVSAYLPVERRNDALARRDWDYLTEFLQHRFLLADQATLVLGGRNVENAHHMRPNRLSTRQIFIDTDLAIDLGQPATRLSASFERLWMLDSVATIDEVRSHAPNDLLVNFDIIEAAQVACNRGRDEGCLDRYLDKHMLGMDERMDHIAQTHRQRLETFRKAYRPAPTDGGLALDAAARIHYVENLPVANGQRSYGARHGDEAEAGKHIQSVWRGALARACSADDSAGQDIVLHNAYLFLPASLLQDLAAVLDGSRPCKATTVTMLTNSLETTDLEVVNLLAAWQLKALADHLAAAGPAATATRLRYLEYLPATAERLSLHSKVMVFGNDIFIGSANADVRSLMMDSSNGVFIQRAPRFVGAYRERLAKLVADPQRIADRTALIARERPELATEMSRTVDRLLARYATEDRLQADQERELKRQIIATTEQVYELSRAIMRGDDEAADRFNALFKAI